MQSLKTIVYLTIAIMIISGCNSETKQGDQENNSKNDTASADPNMGKETASFQKSLQFKNISFEVNTKGSGSLRQLVIQPKGFSETNHSVELEIDGKVIDAQVADLNSDGYPELVIFTQSAGSGSYGNVIAFSANGGKSMSQVYFPPASENRELKKGYMGHDSFSIIESTLIQEYPIYKDSDPNTNPTGRNRRIQYKLVEGEASRKFVADKISESPSK